MGRPSLIAMAAIAAAFATTALAQTADTALPPGVEWAVSPAALLEKTPWGRSGVQGQAARGAALVKCAYDARGSLSQCEAVDERPAGYSFGNSAVALAKRARLKSASGDGFGLTPGSITFIVMFRDEDRSKSAQRLAGSAPISGVAQQDADRSRQQRSDATQRALDRDPRATSLR